jgi:hypothetical protein
LEKEKKWILNRICKKNPKFDGNLWKWHENPNMDRTDTKESVTKNQQKIGKPQKLAHKIPHQIPKNLVN